jgi:hypothetical protein
MCTLVETSVVYVCNFIDTDLVDNTVTHQVAALGVLNHSTQHCKHRYWDYKQTKTK